jgi:hypothetical protein
MHCWNLEFGFFILCAYQPPFSVMKRLTTTLTVILLTGCIAKSQSSKSSESKSTLPKIAFGIKGGINVARLSSWFYSEQSAVAGINLGFYSRIPIAEEVFFRPEIMYSSQGGKSAYATGVGVIGGKTTVKLNYIAIPLLFEYGNNVTFQGGVQLGVLLNANEEGNFLNQAIAEDINKIMKSTDFSIILGFGFYAGKNFNAGARYNIGVTDIVDVDEKAGFKDFPPVQNRVIHLYIAYSF